jgi:hypothetical protein
VQLRAHAIHGRGEQPRRAREPHHPGETAHQRDDRVRPTWNGSREISSSLIASERVTSTRVADSASG